MGKRKAEYSTIQRAKAYFAKKSELYNREGYRLAQPLTRNRKAYEDHCYAYMVDLCIALFPVCLWMLVFAFVISGIVPLFVLTPLYILTLALLVVTCLFLIGWVSFRTHGQTPGRFLLGLKIVNRKKKEVRPIVLLLREVIEFGIPIILLGYFFSVLGMALYWVVNSIVVLASPKQQTIADWLLGTQMVYEAQSEIRFESDVKKELARSPIDLHVHSNFSDDGYYDVEDLFQQAKNAGIQVLSITDHNCARANTIARRMGVLYGVSYIPGIEIDCSYRGRRLRVLGYYIDEKNELFASVESESLKREKKASLERARKFEEYTGMVVDMEKMLEKNRFQVVSGLDIARAVFAREAYREYPLVQKYWKDRTEEEAMRQFAADLFQEGGPCYVESTYPALKDILEIVHLSGGIAVLSSWGCDAFADDFLEKVLAEGFDGVEVFSPLVRKETTTRLLKLAKAHKLFISAGSDFHGPKKNDRYLGVTGCPDQALPLVEILTQAASQKAAA